MKTTPAPINIIRPQMLTCPAVTRDCWRLPQRHRSAVLHDGAAMVPQLSRTIRRLVEMRANDAGHDHLPAA